MNIKLNGVQVARFGPKLCQNDAADFRIILGALLGPETQLEKSKIPKVIKIPIITVQNHQVYIAIPDKPWSYSYLTRCGTLNVKNINTVRRATQNGGKSTGRGGLHPAIPPVRPPDKMEYRYAV